MNRLLRILVVHSIRDIVRHKSFFVLIAVLIGVDRLLSIAFPIDRSALGLPHLRDLTANAEDFVFHRAPGIAWNLLTDYRTLVTLGALFLGKEIISLWPSSDMRRMHRGERERSGVLASLAILRWQQVAWDACAAASIVTVTALWGLLWYVPCRALWLASPSIAWLMLFGVAMALYAPVFIAGMSYSSKLAVIAQGGFREKLWLFYRLFLDWSVLWRSWVLFALRLLIEGLFVAVIPAGAFIAIDNFWLRIAVASLSAAPAYSYVKMASFKFFLEVYRQYPRVQDEFRQYYTDLGI